MNLNEMKRMKFWFKFKKGIQIRILNNFEKRLKVKKGGKTMSQIINDRKTNNDEIIQDFTTKFLHDEG